jgi:hypothetical protein
MRWLPRIGLLVGEAEDDAGVELEGILHVGQLGAKPVGMEQPVVSAIPSEAI